MADVAMRGTLVGAIIKNILLLILPLFMGIWGFVVSSLGASLMGLVGMLIFIPLVSVAYTLLRGIVNRRLGLKK